MTVRERILALRLLEKQKKNPELAKQLGINVYMKKKGKEWGQCVRRCTGEARPASRQESPYQS